MNKTNCFVKNIFAGAVAMAIITSAVRANAENIPQLITIIGVHGGARASTDGGKTYPIMLKKGDTLNQGAIIQTAEAGTVDIVLGEAQANLTSPLSGGGAPPTPVYSPGSGKDSGSKPNVVRIFPNSVLAVDKLTLEKTGQDEVADTQLDLKAGKILGNVKKLSSASRYEIKIPNGVAGIRGTTYLIGANGMVYVLAGSVVISYVDGTGTLRTATVMGGQAFNPATQTVINLTPAEIQFLTDNTPVTSLLTGPGPGGPTDHTVMRISPN
jgi:hypothetical protein